MSKQKMNNYIELIKELRENASNSRDLYLADVIEELSQDNEKFAKMAMVFIEGMHEISDKCADIAGILSDER